MTAARAQPVSDPDKIKSTIIAKAALLSVAVVEMADGTYLVGAGANMPSFGRFQNADGFAAALV